MHERSNTLNTWLQNFCGAQNFTLEPLAGDASFRRYFRLETQGRTHIVMDSPLEYEPINAWIEINQALGKHGLHPPEILAQEHEQGFLVLEDFGDQSFMSAIHEQNADTLYVQAMDTLLHMQQISTSDLNLARFDVPWMLTELQIMDDWFVQKMLSMTLSSDQQAVLRDSFQWIATRVAQQPTTFIHRDYHSRNLMINHNAQLGLIDFQDAMIGPITYDLVSLLKDCYLIWPESKRRQWLTYFYQNLPYTTNLSLNEFEQAFELCGLQRHLKVLGVFSRLNLRDQKPNYIKDLPGTFNYIIACLAKQTELKPLYTLMQATIQPRFIEFMDGL